MDIPPVQVTVRDPQTDVKYEVCAYRPLTRNEALAAIAMYRRQHKKSPRKGSVIRILTTFGANEAL